MSNDSGKMYAKIYCPRVYNVHLEESTGASAVIGTALISGYKYKLYNVDLTCLVASSFALSSYSMYRPAKTLQHWKSYGHDRRVLVKGFL